MSAIDLIPVGSSLEELSLSEVLFEFALHGARFSSEWPTIFPEDHMRFLGHASRVLASGPSKLRINYTVLIHQGKFHLQ